MVVDLLQVFVPINSIEPSLARGQPLTQYNGQVKNSPPLVQQLDIVNRPSTSPRAYSTRLPNQSVFKPTFVLPEFFNQ